MKMIIAHNSLNERGGAERVILKIAQHYRAKVLVTNYDRKGTFDEFKNVDVQVIGRRAGIYDAFPDRVANAMHYGFTFLGTRITEDYDVINAHTSPSEWIRNRNERVLWYCHSPPRELYDLKESGTRVRERSPAEKVLYGITSRIYSTQEGLIVPKIEAIATNSSNTNRRLERYVGRGGTVINPGIDCKEFSNKGDGKFFLYFSRISRQKRQDYVIEAFKQFRRLSKGKDYKLVLAGSLSKRYGDFAEYYEQLKSMNARNVLFRPNPSESEKRHLYSRCTAMLFGAIDEDFGIVPLEAMASRKPVISVNEGGPRETILNGRTGYLVDSPEQMAHRMQFIVEHPKLAEQMGRLGRRRVEREYSWSGFFKRFDSVARKVSKM